MARDIHYSESIGTSSSNTTTYQTKLSLTFTQRANGDYFILLSSLFGTNINTTDFRSRLTDGTTTYFDHTVEGGSASEVIPHFSLVRIAGTANPTAKTYNYEFSVESTSLTASLSDARLLAFSRDGADGYIETEGTTSANSTTYVNKLSLSLSVPSTGNYLIVFSTEFDTQSAPNDCGFRITVDGTEQVAALQINGDSTNWTPVGAVLTVNLAAGTRTINLDHRTNATTRSDIRRTRLAAIRLDTFKQSWSASKRTISQTQSLSAVNVHSLTATGSAPGDNIVFTSSFGGAAT